MMWQANRSAIGALGLSALLLASGCTSTTAPPVVPAPDQKETEAKEAEKTVAESPPPKSPATDETKPSESAPVASTATPAESTPTPPEEKPAITEPEKVAQSEAAKTPPTRTGDNADVAKSEPEPQKPKLDRSDLIRLIAFAPAGPMVIDLKVTLDGEPLGKVRSAAIDRIFAAIDEDADGRITWEQFTQDPRVKSGLYGNAAVADGAKLDDLLEKYDVIKNDRVDKEELPRFFSDDRGATNAFSLLAPARPLGSPGEDSMILAWLDMDGDGQLSKEEMSEARGSFAFATPTMTAFSPPANSRRK